MKIYTTIAMLTASFASVSLEFSLFMWYILFVAFILIYVFGIYSIFFAWIVLSKPGISESVRSIILKRHTASIILFIVSSLYISTFSIFVIFIKDDLDV
jgi:hypothetical protein